MIKTFIISLGLTIGLCLGGCGTIDATSGAKFVDSLAAAGCSGAVDLTVNATTAAAGIPSASLTNSFHGSCTGKPVVAAQTPAPTTAP